MKPKPRGARRRTSRRTELCRASQQAARRLTREAAEREWRVFLTAKSFISFTAVTGTQTNPGQVVATSRNPGAIVRAMAVVAGGSGYAYKLFLCGAERME